MTQNPPSRIAIIGAGLAGTACAFVLRKRGFQTVLFDQAQTLAAGASGNPSGLFNPRLSAAFTPESAFYAQAFALAGQTFAEIQAQADIAFAPSGALHLVNAAEKEKRFRKIFSDWSGSGTDIRFLEAREASKIAGIPVGYDALYLPGSGTLSPADLCAAYASGSLVRLGVSALSLERCEDRWSVNGESFDAVILACGAGVKWFRETEWFPLHTVRGQIVQAEQNSGTEDVLCNVCYGGYLSAASGTRTHTLGSTFQKWLTHDTVLEEDNAYILDRLGENLPHLKGTVRISGARAALRTASADRFPIAGAVPDIESWRAGTPKDLPGLFTSTAHGSHGILSTLAAAHVLADQLAEDRKTFSSAITEALSPARFLKRARKKGHVI